MASELDVELEPYEEVVGNLNFSTPVGSRTASPYQRFRKVSDDLWYGDHHLPSENPSNKLKLFPLCYLTFFNLPRPATAATATTTATA